VRLRNLLCALAAAPLASAAGDSGFSLYTQLSGSAGDIGLVSKLDTSLSYWFNRHIAVETGLPVYFVRPSSSAAAAYGASPVNGLGNVRGVLRLSFPNPVLNYNSTFTAWAPTADESRGLSPGKTAVGWSNHIERRFGMVTPFAVAGIANTISDTSFFTRPYTSHGVVSQFEGGADFRVTPLARVGASAYAVRPSGSQTLVSRVNTSRVPPAPPGPITRRRRVFETAPVSTVTAIEARDHGYSVWLAAGPVSSFDFQIGYSRSAAFSLNSVFFGIGINWNDLARRARRF